MDLQQLTDSLRQAVLRNPTGDSSLKIDLKGDGFIHVSGTDVTNEDLPSDCTLIISKPDLDSMLDGSLDSQTALMEGRLELLGDVGVAAKMQSALMTAWVGL